MEIGLKTLSSQLSRIVSRLREKKNKKHSLLPNVKEEYEEKNKYNLFTKVSLLIQNTKNNCKMKNLFRGK